MIQRICDRCKSVTKNDATSITAKVGSFFHQYEQQFDLCHKCFDELNDFIELKKEPTPSANVISSEE